MPVAVHPGHRGQQPVARAGHRAAGVGEHERAGPVGALRVARREARLAEQRRLLITGDAGDGQVQAEERGRVGAPGDAGGGNHLGQRRDRHPQQLAQLGGPPARGDVEQQRAGGVGRVGDVARPAGEPGDQVGVHRPGGQRAVGQARPGGRFLGGQPGQLGAGEVGVEPQAGQLADPVLVPGLAQFVAQPGGPPVLPDDGPPGRGQRRPVPQHRRLPLVGDAQRGDRPRGPVQGLAARRESSLPDVLRQVLHPAGPRVVLREFLVAAGCHGALRGHHQSGYTGCSGVNRKDTHGG